MLKGHLDLLKSLTSIEGIFYPQSSDMYSNINYSYKRHEFWRNFSFLKEHGFLEYVKHEYNVDDDSSLVGKNHVKYKFTVPGLAIREIMISIGGKNFLDSLKELMNVGINAN